MIRANRLVLLAAVVAVTAAEANYYLRDGDVRIEPIVGALVFALVGSASSTLAPELVAGFATVVLVTALLSGPWATIAGRL